MKHHIIIIFSLLLLSGLSSALLVSYTTLPNEKKNGFTRQWLSVSILKVKDQKIDLPVNAISGHSGDRIYLTGLTFNYVFSLSSDLVLRDTFALRIKTKDQIKPPVVMFIDSPNIYIHANNLATMFKGTFDTATFIGIKLPTSIFTKSVHLSDSEVVIRGYKSDGLNQNFQRINITDKKVLDTASVFANKNDAGFSTDGILLTDAKSGRLFYVQYFSNNITCLDKQLHVVYTSNTIDTVKYNVVEITERVDGKGEKTIYAKPRKLVNKLAFVNNKYLFVQSALIADNELRKDFLEKPVIDVYSTNDGQYVGSFHLDFDGKIQSFLLDGSTLYVLGKGSIAKFEIDI